ncbi:hypothetical protein quinque_003054 [Culex quinquefasciatus]
MVNVKGSSSGVSSSAASPSPVSATVASSTAEPYPHVHYLSELPAVDEERLEKIFNKLDRDGNGRIDIHDLSEALREFGLSHQYAERFLKQSDQTQSGDVGLAEFIHYVREHEKNLRLQFTHLDKNRDGKVDLEEMIEAFKELGIDMDRVEAAKLLKRMDKDGSLNISYDEWRDFLLLAPSADIHELVKYWRHSTTRTTTINEPLLGPLVETNDDLDLDLDSQELSLLSLFDLEQAIEHVTELILNPSLFGGGGDSGSSASSIAAGVHQHRGHHHNTHLLVDGLEFGNSGVDNV